VIDQGTATLVAAIIAAFASTLTSLLAAIPRYRDWRRVRKMRARLVELLSGDDAIRSLEWLTRRLGLTDVEVRNMLPDVKAHGVLMADGKEGAALDSRHEGG
jgi:hypothetical protein